MTNRYLIAPALVMLAACSQQKPAEQEINDSTTPLHLLQPDYKTPYGQLDPTEVKATIDRVFAYIDSVTPAVLVDSLGNRIEGLPETLPAGAKLNQGTYRLTSYEWGVMYDALLDATRATGDPRYAAYVSDRVGFLADAAPLFEAAPMADAQMRQVIKPLTLDDAGAMAGAFMRAQMADSTLNLSEAIERYWTVVEESPIRLADGTIARHRPHHNAVWLDDMFMALPSMATRSQYASDPKQLDRAADIAAGFFKRMWMPEKKIFRHGYVEGAQFEPSFAWGRANGWAILTMSQLLDYLPADHPRRAEILEKFRDHAAGLAALQGIDGFWHQILDRPETYDETSATAIFAYCLAHGVNEGWLDAVTFAPVAQLAWEAVATKINAKGEVEDVCVGTGMGFDPAYYAYRPVSVKAAHGYGPAIWAGSEIYKLINKYTPRFNDSAIHYYNVDPEAGDMPIFSLDENGKAQIIKH